MDTSKLDESTWLLYAAKHYCNTQCYDILEFEEDLKRFKYIKRLFNKYIEYGELKERLILNHIIALNNVFTPPVATKMLFFRLDGYESYLAPFLALLGSLPEKVYGLGINQDTLICADIPMDRNISEKLEQI